MVQLLKLLNWNFSRTHFLVCICSIKYNQQKFETFGAKRTNPNVKRSGILKSFTPSYQLTPKWFFKWIHISNPYVPHLLLKNKFPIISLLKNNSTLPPYLSHPIPLDYTSRTSQCWAWCLAHNAFIQLMSSPWMRESMDKVLLLEPTPSSVEILASSYKSMRILTFQMGKPKTHKQHVWQILFLPYPTLRPYVFQGTRPPTEFKWSIFLPVNWPNFNPWHLRGSLLGSFQKHYAPS